MIDFHCHLDLYPDPGKVADTCIERGTYVLSVTTTPSAWLGTLSLAKGSNRIRTSLGLHPQVAHERHQELGLFDRLIGETAYVGEIGLDGSPDFKATWEVQLRVFRHCLATCADAGGRVMSIHTRRSASPVLDELASNPSSGTPILHWFSGTLKELSRAVDLGCWFSVGPGMLRSENGRRLAAGMPPDRVLTESDGPFVRNGDRPIWPWEAADAIDWLSAQWQRSTADVENQLKSNLSALGKLANSTIGTRDNV